VGVLPAPNLKPPVIMRIQPVLLYIFFYLAGQPIFAQNHDYIWLGGISNDGVPPLSDYRIDFGSDPPLITDDPKPMDFYGTCSVMSDLDGNLLFYTNGKWIASHNHQTMQNGAGLSPGDYASEVGDDFVTPPQGTIVLPWPGHEDKYYLFHAPFKVVYDPLDAFTYAFMYTMIDMAENNGLGKVVSKNQDVISDSLWTLKLTAVKHGNGRDWWILERQWLTNTYYKILVSPEGVEVVDTMVVGTALPEGLAQAVFSPDGSKYAVVNGYRTDSTYIQIFDFDRCTGELSNEVVIFHSSKIYAVGLSISPNSRFLYFSARDTLYQYDLWASDIGASEEVVGIYDGFTAPFQTSFFLAQLAPDGKIYITPSNGTLYLHVIEKPNEKGLACDFRQHAVHLGSYNGTGLPNNPNYRLGPLDGSPCDTLEIDNIPMAKFRCQQDTIDYHSVTFTDLSYYEPANWSWDFGDNSTSQDTSPVHTFPVDGVYEVCLTVTNANGENTVCKTLYIGVSAINENTGRESIVKVYPNPASEWLEIGQEDDLFLIGEFRLFNILGEEMKKLEINGRDNSQRLGIGELPNGSYYWNVTCEGNTLQSGKIMKIK
jgi:hypothetical protein